MTAAKKQYTKRGIIELDRQGGHYARHVQAMTAEGLHAKSDIAAELAYRDWEIERLREQRDEALAEAERLRAALEDILAAEDRDGIAITGMRERFERARQVLGEE